MVIFLYYGTFLHVLRLFVGIVELALHWVIIAGGLKSYSRIIQRHLPFVVHPCVVVHRIPAVCCGVQWLGVVEVGDVHVEQIDTTCA